jgi:multidrug efflux pump subunit AcrB
VRLPDGASIDRTDAAVAKLEERLKKVKGVESWFVIGGTDFTTQTSASNVATMVVVAKPWEERKSKDLQLNAILAATQKAFSDVPEAFTAVFGFPPILGLSSTGGFQFMLEDRRGGELEQLGNVGDSLVDAARMHPEIGGIVNTFRSSVPGYNIDVNLDKLQTLGVPVSDAYNTLQTFLGGLYVNDFNRFGHTWQVLIQAEPEFRNQPSDVDRFYVRSVDGNMIPLQPFSGHSDSRRACARGQFRAGHRHHGKGGGGDASGGLRLRMDRHYLSAETGAGTRGRDLRLCHRAGFPVSRGALRKLVHPHGRAALPASGIVRRATGRVSPQLPV